MSVGLDDLLKRKLSELDVGVEEQMNNVLITLRLWIKSFIFMVLLVGLNTFGYSIDDWSKKVELDLRLLRRSWFSHIGDLAPNHKCISTPGGGGYSHIRAI